MTTNIRSIGEALEQIAPKNFKARVEAHGLDQNYSLYFHREILAEELDKNENIIEQIKEELADTVRSHPVYIKLLEMHVRETQELAKDLEQLESDNERLRRFENYYDLEHNMRNGGDKHEEKTITSDS